MVTEPAPPDSTQKPGSLELQNTGNSKPPEPISGKALVRIAIIRAVPVAALASIHDPLVRTMLFALCLYGFVLGAFILLSKMGYVTVRSKRPDIWKSFFVKAAVYGAGAVLVTVGIAADLAQADSFVRKLEEYKQKQGSYPDKLADMVPQVMPSIPSIGLGRLRYLKEANSYTLSYGVAWERTCTYRSTNSAWTCG